ncbi:plastocyanin/azurin family copper-binding protein [Cohnella sp. WQ 127256]|uniref:plastocyanin/azurin family copper-binding protein n=1 Tax=Cohnella sp. WQ 127256 TaxID=2938790 RepID=UPI0021186944|nr:plastocyanin/azurin family copper-binding protein [Cohnella sp. WQ 127256]
MIRKGLAMLLIFTAALMTFSSVFAADTSSSAGPVTWKVSVGKDSSASSFDTMFPGTLYIHEGDKVVFTNGSANNVHTATFLAGGKPITSEDPNFAIPTAPSGVSWDGKSVLNSGMLLPTQSYEITFNASGVYPYYCILHIYMKGSVVVLPKGQPIPSLVEQTAAAKATEDDLRLQESLLNDGAAPAYGKNADGTLTYTVGLGSPNMGLSHNRMNPETVVIAEGDSVAWKNLSLYEPHFVSFNLPPALLAEPESDPTFNPFLPSGGSVQDGKIFTHSGGIMGDNPYILKFTKSGTFTYDCFLHSGYVMKGTVIVVPKTSVKLFVNGKAVAGSAKAQWKGSSLNVSIADFAKALGGSASYDSKLKATVVKVGKGKTSTTGSYAKDGKAVIVNGTVLASKSDEVKGVRYASAEEIVRAVGGTYFWNDITKTFSVTNGAVPAAPVAAPVPVGPAADASASPASDDSHAGMKME